jgi:hypothetical protein
MYNQSFIDIFRCWYGGMQESSVASCFVLGGVAWKSQAGHLYTQLSSAWLPQIQLGRRQYSSFLFKSIIHYTSLIPYYTIREISGFIYMKIVVKQRNNKIRSQCTEYSYWPDRIALSILNVSPQIVTKSLQVPNWRPQSSYTACCSGLRDYDIRMQAHTHRRGCRSAASHPKCN